MWSKSDAEAEAQSRHKRGEKIGKKTTAAYKMA